MLEIEYMKGQMKPIEIGSVVLSSKEIEALRVYRDYKKLRDSAGWRSSMPNLILKDLLGIDNTSQNHGQPKRRRSHPRRPDTGYGY